MAEIPRVLDQLHREFEGNAWHGDNVSAILTNVTAQQAAKKPIPQAHSIWELVLHMTTWKIVVRKRIEGDQPNVTDELDWPRVTDFSDNAWERAKKALADAHHHLYDVVAKLDESRLDEKPGPRSNTCYVQIHGIVQHDLYHAGQIAVLKKSFVATKSAAKSEPRPVAPSPPETVSRSSQSMPSASAAALAVAPVREVKKRAGAMVLTSSSFGDGERIPKEHTCDGANISPPLSWSGVPKGTINFALICEDPDAPMGTFTHWVLWGLASDAHRLEEGIHLDTHLPGGARQGLNSFHRIGYGGPCPPPGNAHRYYFKLFALDAAINPPDSADKGALERAMQGHVIEVAQLMGRYGR